MLDLAQRVEATEKVVARFRGRAFDWRGRQTCIHLARAQARALGHRPPSIPDFRSSRGAKTALKATGHATLEALLDSLFPRIAPAAMWVNTLIPKYRSRDHKWEYVASTEPVSVPTFVAADGEVKREERQFNLVQQKDQAAQLCAYELLDRRELGEIEIVVKPRLRKYGPGDLLIVDLPNDGLIQQPCVIMKRQPLPDRMAWKFILSGETPSKHAYALGQTAVAPPVPALGQTADLDAVAAPNDPAVDAVKDTVEQQQGLIEQQAALIQQQQAKLTDVTARVKKLEDGAQEP